jgi:hypothetical protein
MKDMGKVITSKDSNCIDRYFRDIQEYGVLDANDEIELANRVQQGTRERWIDWCQSGTSTNSLPTLRTRCHSSSMHMA